jgi:hypothetical protein
LYGVCMCVRLLDRAASGTASLRMGTLEENCTEEQSLQAVEESSGRGQGNCSAVGVGATSPLRCHSPYNSEIYVRTVVLQLIQGSLCQPRLFILLGLMFLSFYRLTFYPTCLTTDYEMRVLTQHLNSWDAHARTSH